MTRPEFEEETKDFSPGKENIRDKVDALFAKGANAVYVLHFITQHLNCRLTEALKVAESCPNYHKRYGADKKNQ